MPERCGAYPIIAITQQVQPDGSLRYTADFNVTCDQCPIRRDGLQVTSWSPNLVRQKAFREARRAASDRCDRAKRGLFEYKNPLAGQRMQRPDAEVSSLFFRTPLTRLEVQDLTEEITHEFGYRTAAGLLQIEGQGSSIEDGGSNVVNVYIPGKLKIISSREDAEYFLMRQEGRRKYEDKLAEIAAERELRIERGRNRWYHGIWDFLRKIP